ncbi:MAG: hypothetical protein U9N57_01155 [Pseudomonadota bacterium]|nr:hypothetical protein [Pseudomonadota bacterium]
MKLKSTIAALMIGALPGTVMAIDKCNYIVDVKGEMAGFPLVNNHTSVGIDIDPTVHFKRSHQTAYLKYLNTETKEAKQDDYEVGIWGYSTLHDSTINFKLIRKQLVRMNVVKNGLVTTRIPDVKTYEKSLSIPFSKLPASYEINFANGEHYKISAIKSCQ